MLEAVQHRLVVGGDAAQSSTAADTVSESGTPRSDQHGLSSMLSLSASLPSPLQYSDESRSVNRQSGTHGDGPSPSVSQQASPEPPQSPELSHEASEATLDGSDPDYDPHVPSTSESDASVTMAY